MADSDDTQTLDISPEEAQMIMDSREGIVDNPEGTINKNPLIGELYLQNRIIDINQEIGQKTAQEWMQQLDILASMSRDPILLRINSDGGNMIDAYALYDVIRLHSQAGIKIHTLALGKCMSMAVEVFLAGDYRSALPNTTFMLHRGSAPMQGRFDTTLLKEVLDEIIRLEEQSNRIFASRTKRPLKEWRKFFKQLNKDYFFGVSTAKKLGLINR